MKIKRETIETKVGKPVLHEIVVCTMEPGEEVEEFLTKVKYTFAGSEISIGYRTATVRYVKDGPPEEFTAKEKKR